MYVLHERLHTITMHHKCCVCCTAGGDEGEYTGTDSDAMVGIAAGYSATTLLTVTSIAALTGVMLARILS